MPEEHEKAVTSGHHAVSDIDLLQTIELLKAHQSALQKIHGKMYAVPYRKASTGLLAARRDMCEILGSLADCLTHLESSYAQ